MKKLLSVLTIVVLLFSSCDKGYPIEELDKSKLVGKWIIEKVRSDGSKWVDYYEVIEFTSSGDFIQGSLNLGYNIKGDVLKILGSDGRLYFKYKIKHLCEDDMILMMEQNTLTDYMIDYKLKSK